MSIRTRSTLVAMGFLLVSSSAGFAQQPTIEGAYRGSIVCQHLSGTTGILRGPLDIIVSGTTVVAARPIFNRNGSRVVGSEIATGTVNSDGTLHLTSSWPAVGGGFKGTYNGTLNATGGTITGTQAWKRSQANGGNVLRTCYGAYVTAPTPDAQSGEAK